MTASVPLRYRRGLRKARRNGRHPTTSPDDGQLEVTELRLLAELDAAPVDVAPKPERTPLRERWQPKPVKRASMADPAAWARWLFFKALPNEVSHHWRRLDWYAADVGRATGRGVRRSVVGGWEWVRMPRHRQVLAHLIDLGDDDRFARLSRRYAERTRNRALTAAGILAAVITVLALLWSWNRAGAVLVTVTALALIGRTPDAPRKRLDTRPAKPERLTPDKVVTAFAAPRVGLPEAETVGGAARREGPDRWEVLVDLRPGDTVTQALAKRDELASALREETGCVHLEPGGGHAGRVQLTLFDRDPMTMEPTVSPLLTATNFSLWEGLPIGHTITGEPYRIILPGTNGMYICAAPGFGKTSLVLAALAGGSLDERCGTMIHDGKGQGGLAMYESSAEWYSQGHDEAGQRACLKMLDTIEGMEEDRARKLDQLRRTDSTLMPHGEISRAVTDNAAYGLPLIMAVIDELNFLVERGNSKLGKSIQAKVLGLTQLIRSGGTMLVIAGQRFDADTLDGAQSSLGIRVAFRTNSPEDSNMVLGSGQVGAGWNTSLWPDNYQGVCVVRPSGHQMMTGTRQIKTHLMNQTQHEAVAARCKRLGGVVLTKEPAERRVRRVMGTDAVLDLVTAAERLGDDVDKDALAKELRRDGIEVRALSSRGNRLCVWADGDGLRHDEKHGQ